MKKWIGTLFGALGFAGNAMAAEEAQVVDPSKIMFSIPTIADDLAPVVALTAVPDRDEPRMHEDDWCQVEFFRASYLPDLKKMLEEYKSFEVEHRHTAKDYTAWRNIYVRKVSRVPLISSAEPVDALQKVVGGKVGRAMVLSSASAWTGRVQDGFTLRVGTDVDLYGYVANGAIPVLGAALGEAPDRQSLTQAFAELHSEFDLVLVDWKSQFILTGVASNGEVQVWQPQGK